jgi:hypothetical protein
MKTFPLLFQFRDIVAGNGFLARVLVDGRALLTVEDDGDQWVYGVQPGSISGGASDAATALNEFKTRYQSVLFDIAGEAPTFEDFKREVRAFFDTVNQKDESEWMTALDAVRHSPRVHPSRSLARAADDLRSLPCPAAVRAPIARPETAHDLLDGHTRRTSEHARRCVGLPSSARARLPQRIARDAQRSGALLDGREPPAEVGQRVAHVLLFGWRESGAAVPL